MRRLTVVALATLPLTVGTMACTADPTPTALGTDSTATTTLPSLNRVDAVWADTAAHRTIADLRDAIVGAGMTCELEYDGLDDGTRVISLCATAGEQLLLTIWHDPDLVRTFVDSGEAGPTVAWGRGWTVEADSAALAERLAEVLGGEVGGRSG